MIERKLLVTLVIRGPLLTQATAAGALGIDSPVARTPDGEVYFPYSLVKGRLREALRDLDGIVPELTAVLIDRWFGKSTDDEFDTHRGSLHFSDFVASRRGTHDVMCRIQRDPVRKSVAEGQLQMLETPFASGERVPFVGHVTFVGESAAALQPITEALQHGFRWITSLGAERTSGYGRIDSVETMTSDLTLAPRMTCGATVPAQLGVRLRVQRPFCLAKPKHDGNLFESESIISGAALKGAIASRLRQICGLPPSGDAAEVDETQYPEWAALGRQLSRIRITHAFPVRRGGKQRPVEPPLSLVKSNVSDSGRYRRWHDVALCERPMLIGGRAPSFSIDWKNDSDVRSAFGWTELHRELRVRTAIDPDRRRAAENQLFAMELIEPSNVEWLATIDLSDLEDDERISVASALFSLAEVGLRHIGKTKAPAEFQMVAAENVASIFTSDPEPLKIANGRKRNAAIRPTWVVTLQSPALLCDPDTFVALDDEHALERGYAEAWNSLQESPELKLNRFFARQRLTGGEYFARQFHKLSPDRFQQYGPYVLTEPGSVFIFELAANGDVNQARDQLAQWLTHGLPLPGWAKNAYGDDWRTCPYRREEGFGEIAVNLPCHIENQAVGEPIDEF